jgi:FeS assembly SUF system regulator
MFRMTKMTDYGILLLTQFAAHEDRPVFTARELAQESRLPLPTVGKLLKQLSHGGLLASQRGTRGGYSLARAPREISVASIIATLEGPVAITECNGAIRCEHESFCSTKPNWQIINETVRASLEDLTLADMTRPLAPRRSLGLPAVASSSAFRSPA